MKRKIGLLMTLVLLIPMLNGCTKPTQVIAEDAMRRAKVEEHKIVKDLSLQAGQSALDVLGEKLEKAVAAQDLEAAEAAVLAYAKFMEKIHKLEIYHERSLRVLGVAERYIWEQQGAFDVLIEEWGEARAIHKAKKAKEVKSETSG